MADSQNSYRFNKAIVRKPGSSLINGITTAGLGLPDYARASQQHDNYIRTLQSCGVEVQILKADDDYPDSVFVEDTAVLAPEFAVISRPQPSSRSGEIRSMEMNLGRIYDKIEKIRSPGTLEGGDVMQIKNSFYIGISERTNGEGADQFIRIVEQYGYRGIKVALGKILHLKTGVSYLGGNTILACKELAAETCFDPYEKILVHPAEVYAANCIRVNDIVIFPAGFPVTRETLKNKGFRVTETGMSEFRKLDGGLSCLSLRFRR